MENVLLSAAIYYFRLLYTTFDGYILFLRLYITFDGYILLLALPYWDFTWIVAFSAICYICGSKARFENINLLSLIQFCFFFSSMVSSIYLNLLFWKCCFIKNTQMLKMWNFLRLALQMVNKENN